MSTTAVFSRGLSYGFLSRFGTMLLGIFVARKLGPKISGIATIQLELLLQTSLFLAKEAFRRACLRSNFGVFTRNEEIPKNTNNNLYHLSSMINLAWLGVPVTLLVTAVTCSLYLYRPGADVLELVSSAGWKEAVLMYGLGAVLESISEPPAILAQNLLYFGVQASVEGAALLVRCVALYILSVHFELGIGAVAYAQFLYGLTLCVGFYSYLYSYCSFWSPESKGKSFRLLFPRKLPRVVKAGEVVGGLFDLELLRFLRSFGEQAVEKYLLTQGQKIVMVGFVETTSSDRGVYGLVNNLGSIVARSLFFPVESTCSMLFNKLLHSSSSSMEDTSTSGSGNASASLNQSAQLLAKSLRLISLVSLYLAAFGPPFSFFLLRLLYGETWSSTDAPLALSWYCLLYVPAMGANGVIEAFVSAAASKQQIRSYSAWLIVCTAAYLGSAVAFGGSESLGARGLIIAECTNFALRVVYGLRFIHLFFSQNSIVTSFSLLSCFPSRGVLMIFTISSILAHLSESLFGSFTLLHFGSGVFLFLTSTLSVYRFDRGLALDVLHLLRNRRQ